MVWGPLSLDWGPVTRSEGAVLNYSTIRECKIKNEDDVMLGKKISK